MSAASVSGSGRLEPMAGHGPEFRAPVDPNVIDIGNHEPIKFIEDRIKQLSGKQKLDEVERFKVSGDDVKNDDGTIKVTPHGNPPHFTFHRTFKVRFTNAAGDEQTVTFQKQIYTNIRIPIKSIPLSRFDKLRRRQPRTEINQTEYDNSICLAGMAAKAYVKSVQDAVKFKNDPTKTGSFGGNTQEKVDSLQRQGYVSIYLMKDGKRVENALYQFRTRSLADRKVKLLRSDITGYEIGYDKKKVDLTNTVAHDALMGPKLSKRLERADRYQLIPGPNDSLELKNFASSLKVIKIQEEDADSLDQVLQDNNLSNREYLSHVESYQHTLKEEFEEDRSMFYDASKLDDLVRKYGKRGATTVSDTFKNHFMEYVPKKSRKSTASPLIQALHAMSQDPNLSWNERVELGRLATCFQNAKERLREVNAQMDRNEADILTINRNNKKLKDQIEKAQEKRSKVIKHSHLPKIKSDVRNPQRPAAPVEQEEEEP